MMRKLFGGTMAFSLVGSAVLGGVLAWSAYSDVPGENEVGWADLDVSYNDLDTLLGPNGYAKKVGTFDVENNGTFSLKPGTGAMGIGQVQIISVENDPDGIGDPVTEGNCTSEEFENSGTRLKLGNGLPLNFLLNPTESEEDAVEIWIGVDADAPNSCQGDDVSWRAFVVFETAGTGEVVGN